MHYLISTFISFTWYNNYDEFPFGLCLIDSLASFFLGTITCFPALVQNVNLRLESQMLRRVKMKRTQWTIPADSFFDSYSCRQQLSLKDGLRKAWKFDCIICDLQK